MKSLSLVCLAFIVSVSTMAQPTTFGSFKAEDQEIKFQKVFTQDSITLARLEAYYKTVPELIDVIITAEGITMYMNDVVVDFKKFKFRQVDVPSLIQTGKYSGKVLVSVRDGRYRVSITSFEITGDAGYRKITTKEPFTNVACMKSGTVLNPDWCKPNSFGLLEQVFTDKLQYVQKKDDW